MKFDRPKPKPQSSTDYSPLSTTDHSGPFRPKDWMNSLAASAERPHAEVYIETLNKDRAIAYRRKMLEAMGLSEEYLHQMNSERQLNVDQMIELEVRKRIDFARCQEARENLSSMLSARPDGLGEFHHYLEVY